MSLWFIEVRQGVFQMDSRSCAGLGFPLRHCADPMKVSGERGVLLARSDEKISDR